MLYILSLAVLDFNTIKHGVKMMNL